MEQRDYQSLTEYPHLRTNQTLNLKKRNSATKVNMQSIEELRKSEYDTNLFPDAADMSFANEADRDMIYQIRWRLNRQEERSKTGSQNGTPKKSNTFSQQMSKQASRRDSVTSSGNPNQINQLRHAQTENRKQQGCAKKRVSDEVLLS